MKLITVNPVTVKLVTLECLNLISLNLIIFNQSTCHLERITSGSNYGWIRSDINTIGTSQGIG